MSRNLFFFFQNQDVLSVGAKIAYLVSLLLSRAASRMSMRLLSEGASALRNRTPCAGKISSMYVVLTEERRQMREASCAMTASMRPFSISAISSLKAGRSMVRPLTPLST